MFQECNNSMECGHMPNSESEYEHVVCYVVHPETENE